MFFQNRREQSITAIVFKYVGDKSLKKKNQNYFKSKYLAHSNFLKMLNELSDLCSLLLTNLKLVIIIEYKGNTVL